MGKVPPNPEGRTNPEGQGEEPKLEETEAGTLRAHIWQSYEEATPDRGSMLLLPVLLTLRCQRGRSLVT